MPKADKDNAADLPNDAHFEAPPADDTKCAGRPGCKSNRLSQGTGEPWVCDTCRRG